MKLNRFSPEMCELPVFKLPACLFGYFIAAERDHLIDQREECPLVFMLRQALDDCRAEPAPAVLHALFGVGIFQTKGKE